MTTTADQRVDLVQVLSEGTGEGQILPSAAVRLDLLLAFVVLAEELHFTRAAERLFLSQSGLSRRLAVLERAVGKTLVLRSTRSAALSTAGEALLPHARLILQAVADGAVSLGRVPEPLDGEAV